MRVEVLDPLSDTGSNDASGDVLGDVDIGDPAVCSPLEPLVGASSRSRNGFLLLLGEVKGFDRPMVANFCPLSTSSVPLVWLALMKGLVNGLVTMGMLSVKIVSFWTPAFPFWEKWVTLIGSWRLEIGALEAVEVGGRTVGWSGVDRVERSSRLEGWVEAGSSVSRSSRLEEGGWRFRVSLSPP